MATKVIIQGIPQSDPNQYTWLKGSSDVFELTHNLGQAKVFDDTVDDMEEIVDDLNTEHPGTNFYSGNPSTPPPPPPM